MKTTLWLTTFSMFLSAPLGFSKSELETLRSTVNEQERQIRQLEEENMKLRSLNGQPVKAPIEKAPVSKPEAAPASNAASTYTVKAGDTLAKIGRKTGNSAQALARLNGIKDPSRLSIGQKLKLPGGTVASVSDKKETPATSGTVAGSDTYVVRDGETFYSIARKHKVSAESLVAANPGIKASELRTGQLIRLNSKTVAAAPVASKEKEPARQQTTEPVVNHPATPAHNTPPAAPANSAAASPAAPASPAPAPAASAPKTAVHSVTIDGEMTYGEFAAKHGTKIERLNELNGLDLTQSTVLAKGSELYVNAQP